MASSRLFEPLSVGNESLQHRVVMAPLTRFRAGSDHVPSLNAKEYYTQRASVPGTLIITEATFISPRASGYKNVPGIWNNDQIEGWKNITTAVHERGSYIWLQLWALGRTADAEVLRSEGDYSVSSSSAVAIDSSQHILGLETPPPSALTKAEIQVFVQGYAQAARNAMQAGFDGVEIHGANGYLIDQFWQDAVNRREDDYGGSIANRSRFGLDVTEAVIKAVGDSNKVAMRLSPWSTGQGMGMTDPVPQFVHIIERLKDLGIGYLHLVEQRIAGRNATDATYQEVNRQNDVFVQTWGEAKPVILAGGFNLEKANRVVNEQYQNHQVGIAFGRYFISTPDLPFRLKAGIELNKWDRATFYGPNTAVGYTDYPFSEEWKIRATMDAQIVSS